MIRRLLRWREKRYAARHSYFWLPCPLCKKEFGGHEWRDIDGLSSTIYYVDNPMMGRGICPDCTRAGKGGVQHPAAGACS